MARKQSMQTRLVFVLAILTICVIAGCAAKKNLWGDSKTGLILSYRMPEDQVLKYRSTNELIQTMEVMDQTMEIEMTKEYNFSTKSKGLKENDHKLSVTLDSASINIFSPQGEFSPDMSPVIGKSFDMILSHLG